MSTPRKNAIEIRDLSKRYYLNQSPRAAYGSLRDNLANLFRNNTTDNKPEPFWALKDVSFNVAEGDVVGILGKNGSGKSTLLKMVSQIVNPTSGSIRVRGRVASLLEVGTGFHAELSGRENIYFNGSILGMSRREIEQKMNDIIEFSGVEQFIDMPVKFYSSGMYVRLAFSVAAHVDPDILIVDEVLAVGDAAFQKKCLDRIRSFTKSGKTVLFVSHSIDSVEALCNRAVLLEKGGLVLEGTAEAVIARYTGIKLASPGVFDEFYDEQGAKDIKIKKIVLHQGSHQAQHTFAYASPLVIDAEFENNKHLPTKNVRIDINIVDDSGHWIASFTHNKHADMKGDKLQITVPELNLSPGIYYGNFSFHTNHDKLQTWAPRAFRFEVTDSTHIIKTGAFLNYYEPMLIVEDI